MDKPKKRLKLWMTWWTSHQRMRSVPPKLLLSTNWSCNCVLTSLPFKLTSLNTTGLAQSQSSNTKTISSCGVPWSPFPCPLPPVSFKNGTGPELLIEWPIERYRYVTFQCSNMKKFYWSWTWFQSRNDVLGGLGEQRALNGRRSLTLGLRGTVHFTQKAKPRIRRKLSQVDNDRGDIPGLNPGWISEHDAVSPFPSQERYAIEFSFINVINVGVGNQVLLMYNSSNKRFKLSPTSQVTERKWWTSLHCF